MEKPIKNSCYENQVFYLRQEFDAGMFGVYVRCEQFGKSILIDTNVHVFHDEWDGENGLIIRNPNARKLNLFIRKTLYQIEEYELDYDGEFTLSKLKEIWEGRESSNNDKRYIAYVISMEIATIIDYLYCKSEDMDTCFCEKIIERYGYKIEDLLDDEIFQYVFG